MTTPLELTPKEVKLIEFVRSLSFGTLQLEVKAHEPVRIINPLQSVIL